MSKHPKLSVLEVIFGQVNGSSIVSIDTATVPTMRGGKANPHMGRVLKHSYGHNVMVFQNKNTNAYENMVERRLIQEGKDPTAFELKPRKWGERIKGTPFVEHNGQLYLEVIFLRPAKDIFYTLDGLVVAPEFIQGLVLEHTEAEQGGLENKVILRDFKFESIRKVRVNGQEYTINH